MPTATDYRPHPDRPPRPRGGLLRPDLDGIPRDYHPDFVDHVNRFTYRGHDGARQSVALYLALFPDLRFDVDDQVTEGDKVASRWTLRGTHEGREVELRGIVISRFEDGRIIEDWAASDTAGAGPPARPPTDAPARDRASQADLRSDRLSRLPGRGLLRRAVDRITCRFPKGVPVATERDREDPQDLRQAGAEVRQEHVPLRAAAVRRQPRMGLRAGRGRGPRSRRRHRDATCPTIGVASRSPASSSAPRWPSSAASAPRS